MAKVVQEDTGNLQAVLTITISKEDYEPRLNAELAKYRKTANIKGFRKGKVPIGFIKKMYGKGLMAESVTELMQKSLSDYITDNEIEILGQPIPSEEQEPYDFDASQTEDYTFKIDIGIAPQFEVQGMEGGQTYERHAVGISDEMVEKDMMAARKRLGERESVDDGIEENDMLSLNAEELDGEGLKENGWASTFSVLISQIADEDLKKEFLSKSKGDKIRFDIRKLEKNSNEDHIRKHLLQVEDSDGDVVIGNHFEAAIADVSRIAPAEVDEEFLTKYFGEGKVKDEQEAKEVIRMDIQKYYDNQADSLLFRDIQKRLIELNELDLPDEFLKRWLKVTNEEATDELIEKEYDAFAENLKWSLIRSKLIRKFELKVTDNELVEGFKNRIRNYFGGHGNELVILNTANRLMEDKTQVDNMYKELITEKLFVAMRDASKIKDKKISTDEFDELIKEEREKVAEQQEHLEHGSDEALEEPEEEVTQDVEQ